MVSTSRTPLHIGEPGVLFQTTLGTDDDAVKIAPLFCVDNVTGKDILAYIAAIEYRDLGKTQRSKPRYGTRRYHSR